MGEYYKIIHIYSVLYAKLNRFSYYQNLLTFESRYFIIAYKKVVSLKFIADIIACNEIPSEFQFEKFLFHTKRCALKTSGLFQNTNLFSDVNYRMKLLQGSQDSTVENCKPNPCLNGGKCLTTNGRSTCQCFGHFTGN